jgi:hypothetical protein
MTNIIKLIINQLITIHIQRLTESKPFNSIHFVGNKGYSIELSTNKNIFFCPETTEIRDHFIKSLAFRDVNIEVGCMLLKDGSNYCP